MKNVTPTIRSWHSPNNEECAQNQDVDADCTCKKKRKPFRVVRVHAKDVNHGVNPNIVIEIHPDGVLKFRESRRPHRFAYETTTGEVYAGLVLKKARAEAAKRNHEIRVRKSTVKAAKKLKRKLEREARLAAA